LILGKLPPEMSQIGIGCFEESNVEDVYAASGSHCRIEVNSCQLGNSAEVQELFDVVVLSRTTCGRQHHRLDLPG
jgi:hypothetical protein